MTWNFDCHQKGHEHDERFPPSPYAKLQQKGFFFVPCKKCACFFLVEAEIPLVLDPKDVQIVQGK